MLQTFLFLKVTNSSMGGVRVFFIFSYFVIDLELFLSYLAAISMPFYSTYRACIIWKKVRCGISAATQKGVYIQLTPIFFE